MTSFDGSESIRCALIDPASPDDLHETLASLPVTVPRGAGLSYCAASMGAGVCSVSTRRMTGIEIDGDTGLATVEPGAGVGSLLDAAIAKGWYPPVLPGHPSITVGGCIGFNVHGKSQFNTGNFESCVRRLWVLHPDHGEVECGPAHNADMWRATLGGFGLSGFVTRAEIGLSRLKGGSIEVRRVPTANLIEAVEQMEDLKREHETIYSWNDLNLRGRSFGKGHIYAESFSAERVPDVETFNVLEPPAGLPDRLGLLNRLTTPIMCTAYGLKERLSGSRRLVGLRSGSFPINGKEIYFRLFGRSGFLEYQFIVPREAWTRVSLSVARLIEETRAPISLGSLKLFSGRSHLLNFCMPGVCLALDVPASARAVRLFAGLDDLMAKHGGIVNVAKDSRLTAETVKRLFPAYEEHRAALREIEGERRRFDSALRRRIGL